MPRLTFRSDGQNVAPINIDVTGKSFRLAPSRYSQDGIENAELYETITVDAVGMDGRGDERKGSRRAEGVYKWRARKDRRGG